MNSQNSISRTDSSGGHVPLGPLCPHVANPFDECHCVNMTSQKITLVLAFCGDDFEHCEIYSAAISREQ